MKLRVTVDGRTFEVDVPDPRARPLVAVVEGERFEVWPEETEDRGRTTKDEPLVAAVTAAPAVTNGKHVAGTNGHHAPTRESVPPAAGAPSSSVVGPSSTVVQAPIPGVIISVSVQPGQAVTAGQELCLLEAMKMQNAIRAPRDGVIAVVRVTPGQHVRHREALMEYQA
jgi:biotin carboxyl carrier protein